MRRLPNTYPGDVTKYPTGRGTIGIGAPDAGSKVLFYNETPVNLDLDFYNGNTDVLHAWEANFWTLDGEVGDITWAIDTDSLAVVNPPINAVFTTLLNPEEKLNDKAYPMPLIRQIGGQQAIVSSASQTINDGNALQQVVEATLQGHGSSDVIINNDGSYTIKGAGLLAAVGILTHILGTLTVDGASTFTGELTASSDVKTNIIRDNVNGNVAIDLSAGTGGMSLAKAAILTHILGTLTVDQATEIVGALTADSTITSAGILTVNAASVLGRAASADGVTINGKLQVNATANGIATTGPINVAGASTLTGIATFTVDPRLTSKKIADGNGNNMVDWTGAGLFLKGDPSNSGKCNYQGNGANTDWFITSLSTFTGSGSGTYNHGMLFLGVSSAPAFIAPIVTVAGSATQGYDTVTSTQAHITLGAALAFKGLCYA